MTENTNMTLTHIAHPGPVSDAERTALIAAHGPAPLWVRQVGTFDLSLPLLLASLS